MLAVRDSAADRVRWTKQGGRRWNRAARGYFRMDHTAMRDVSARVRLVPCIPQTKAPQLGQPGCFLRSM